MQTQKLVVVVQEKVFDSRSSSPGAAVIYGKKWHAIDWCGTIVIINLQPFPYSFHQLLLSKVTNHQILNTREMSSSMGLMPSFEGIFNIAFCARRHELLQIL